MASTANRYLHSINDVINSKQKIGGVEQIKLNDTELIYDYLKSIADR